MTSPALPTFIPVASHNHAIAQRRRRRYARRQAFINNCLLFIFFTCFFAVITVAIFS